MITTIQHPENSGSFGAPGRIGEHVWAVVLAGGEGMRLRELTRHLYGDERPKQYAPGDGDPIPREVTR